MTAARRAAEKVARAEQFRPPHLHSPVRVRGTLKRITSESSPLEHVEFRKVRPTHGVIPAKAGIHLFFSVVRVA
jgi:hypothetical protein